MIIIRSLALAEVGRLAEIDRTEHVTVGYHCEGDRLVAGNVDWHVPRWYADETPEHQGHSLPVRIRHLGQAIREGCTVLGAFDGEALAGIAVLHPHLTPEMAELGGLWVSNGHRRQGIATQLVAEICRLARATGAQSLYVSATPSASAVGFYQSQGFCLAEHPDERLLALEPEDIHMIKSLTPPCLDDK